MSNLHNPGFLNEMRMILHNNYPEHLDENGREEFVNEYANDHNNYNNTQYPQVLNNGVPYENENEDSDDELPTLDEIPPQNPPSPDSPPSPQPMHQSVQPANPPSSPPSAQEYDMLSDSDTHSSMPSLVTDSEDESEDSEDESSDYEDDLDSEGYYFNQNH